MLQCHPHPGDFSDKSRLFHCCYFMGLQRKQGVPVNEGEQFDIRLTVEEFKHSVNIYTLWKPGMEIRVSHVKRRNIPNFVFPGGVRPARPSKVTWDSKRLSELKVSSYAQPDKSCESKAVSEGADDGKKRKRVEDDVETNSRNLKLVAPSSGEVRVASPQISTISSSSIKYENMDINKSVESQGEKSVNIPDNLRKLEDPADIQNGETEVSSRCDPPTKSPPAAVADASSSKEAEKLAIEKIMSGPYVNHQTFPRELDELEDDFDNSNQAKDCTGNMKESHIEASKPSVAIPVTSNAGTGPSTGLYLNGGLEELEVNPITFLSAYKCVFLVLYIVMFSLDFIYFVYVCIITSSLLWCYSFGNVMETIQRFIISVENQLKIQRLLFFPYDYLSFHTNNNK